MKDSSLYRLTIVG